MARVLVIQHVAHEGLGIIGPALFRAGIEVEFLKIYDNAVIPRTIDGYSALIVLGGPMGVYETDVYPFIEKEVRLISSALRMRLPILGVCLGAQLLAKAAGAKVYKGSAKEIGWYDVELTEEGSDDMLFLGMPYRFNVFQWHGDTFDVPRGGVRLASSGLFPNQVIKVGANAYGFQFHLEVTEEMVKEWIAVNRDELNALKGKIDPDAIVRETPARIVDLHRYGTGVVARFLRLIRD